MVLTLINLQLLRREVVRVPSDRCRLKATEYYEPNQLEVVGTLVGTQKPVILPDKVCNVHRIQSHAMLVRIHSKSCIIYSLIFIHSFINSARSCHKTKSKTTKSTFTDSFTTHQVIVSFNTRTIHHDEQQQQQQ